MNGAPDQEPDKEPTIPLPKDRDYLLAILTSAAAEHGVTFDLTILVDGTMVAGTAIGAAEYMERLSEQFAEMWPTSDPEEDQSTPSWQEVFDIVRVGEEQPHGARRTFVYLKDATITRADGRQVRAPLWRSRLSHIGGWSVGVPDPD